MSTSLSPSSACQISGGRSSMATVIPTWFTGLFVNVWMARAGRGSPRNSQRSPVRVSSSACSRVSMFAYSRSTPDSFACDLARADGRGVTRIARHVVDHLFDFLKGQPVVQGDLEVGLQLVAGPQRDESAEGHQAARATIQAS